LVSFSKSAPATFDEDDDEEDDEDDGEDVEAGLPHPEEALHAFAFFLLPENRLG
jgi:hypothetical protein